VAQTGHILRVKNRPGNVHDSKQSAAFLRELIDGVRSRLGRRLPPRRAGNSALTRTVDERPETRP
jgi:hypothetical protein